MCIYSCNSPRSIREKCILRALPRYWKPSPAHTLFSLQLIIHILCFEMLVQMLIFWLILSGEYNCCGVSDVAFGNQFGVFGVCLEQFLLSFGRGSRIVLGIDATLAQARPEPQARRCTGSGAFIESLLQCQKVCPFSKFCIAVSTARERHVAGPFLIVCGSIRLVGYAPKNILAYHQNHLSNHRSCHR